MNFFSENSLEEQKNALLALYSADELQLFHNILEGSSFLENNLNTIIEIKTEVGTDGK